MSYRKKWEEYLKEDVQDELFLVEMTMSFPLTRDVELETLYNLLRAIPAVTRVNAEKSQKRATNIYVQLDIKVNKMVIGTKTLEQYVKTVLIPNIFKYATGEYRPNIIPHTIKINPVIQQKSQWVR